MAALLGCASSSSDLPARQLSSLLPADVLLLGEQHDAAAHHQWERQVVEILAVQNRLSALLLEMVDQGHDTRGLPRNAKEAQVKQALQWNDAGWPWNDYAPAIMAAVEAGVPVLGANLPSERQRPAMRDLSLDMRLLQPALERQRAAIRDSHCGLLDEAQVAPMTRIQIARDLAMAQAVMKAPRPPGRTVLLLAGAGHVLRPVGIPAHLPDELNTRVLVAAVQGSEVAASLSSPSGSAETDLLWISPRQSERDHCSELRRRMRLN